MSWRTVIVSNRAKLDFKFGFLVVRGDEVKKLYLNEIGILIIESTAVSLTAALVCELNKRKIKVIFCDEKRNPCSELVSYYGSHDTSLKIRTQIKWDCEVKKQIWAAIVAEKIRQQREHLKSLGKEEYMLLDRYIAQIEPGDATNREGHAAKVYFNALFGMDFSRSRDCNINSALNYGYSIFLSVFNREITANGYLTQLGVFHDNMFNPFNLSSDLMEPFRIIVDKCVKQMDLQAFGKEEKIELVNLVNKEVVVDNKNVYVDNAVKIYCKSVFDALNDRDISLLRFYRDEL